MTPLSPDRLMLPEECLAELMDWRQRHVQSPHDCPLRIGTRAVLDLIDLSAMLGSTPAWWGSTILRLHLYGRVRTEQAEPTVRRRRFDRPLGQVDGDTLWVPAALRDVIADVASEHGQPLDDFAGAVLMQHLHGTLDHVDRPDLTLPAWRQDDAFVKVWMPQTIAWKLQALAEFLGLTRSDVVRNQLLAGLIGRLSYARMVQETLWASCRRDPDEEEPVMFMRRYSGPLPSGETKIAPRTAFIERHGKSTEAFKCYLPSPMRALLTEQAQRSGRRLSHHLREQLVLALEGHLARPVPVAP